MTLVVGMSNWNTAEADQGADYEECFTRPRRSDPAARLAYFLYDFRTPQGMSEEERRLSSTPRFRNTFLTSPTKNARGYQIATELMQADAAKMNAEAAKLKAELRRRNKSESRRHSS